MPEHDFTHLDAHGTARMVDVSSKEPTRRVAEASCVVRSRVDVMSFDRDSLGLDPVAAARLAGIQAAKRTSQLIPLCHPINLSDVKVDVTSSGDGVLVRASVVTVNSTGVEMEALVACAFAAMSLLSVVVASDSDARFDDLVLLHKSGGKSADWGRDVSAPSRGDETIGRGGA